MDATGAPHRQTLAATKLTSLGLALLAVPAQTTTTSGPVPALWEHVDSAAAGLDGSFEQLAIAPDGQLACACGEKAAFGALVGVTTALELATGKVVWRDEGGLPWNTGMQNAPAVSPDGARAYGAGQAQATLVLPALSALVELSARHANLVFGSNVALVSNAMPLSFY